MVISKKGISAVVATVLIILITVAGVTLIWTTIIPMLKENTSFENEMVDLKIVTSEGYTAYDASTGFMTVQVHRGTDNVNISGVQLIVECSDGNANSFELPSVNLNEDQTFKVNPGCEPRSLSVAPVLGFWEEREVGAVSSETNKISKGEISVAIGDSYLDENNSVKEVFCLVDSDCADSNDCTQEVCSSNYVCTYDFEVEGTSCGTGTDFCDGQGNCGVCSINNSCEEIVCKSVVCNSGICDYTTLSDTSLCGNEGKCFSGICEEPMIYGGIYAIYFNNLLAFTESTYSVTVSSNNYVRFSGGVFLNGCLPISSLANNLDIDGVYRSFLFFNTPLSQLSSSDFSDICLLKMGSTSNLPCKKLVNGEKFYIYGTEEQCLNSIV